jgi:phosphatidylethanolamine/phosphatidyl-N-methylethanolamine N-methyltransferase
MKDLHVSFPHAGESWYIFAMPSRIADCRLFVAEFRRNFRTTGAILPSGRRLSQALAHFIRVGPDHPPRQILEVGPGTGAVTRHLIGSMRSCDRLDLVELNQSFVDCLRQRFRQDSAFQPVADRCRVLHAPIEDLPATTPYDVIVSGLPMNNFAVTEVERVLGVLRQLARPGATVSFFEYMGIRRLKAAFSGRSERARLHGIGHVVGRLLRDHEVRRDSIWSNVPPAYVHHMRF